MGDPTASVKNFAKLVAKNTTTHDRTNQCPDRQPPVSERLSELVMHAFNLMANIGSPD
jgi:hypothetical protein